MPCVWEKLSVLKPEADDVLAADDDEDDFLLWTPRRNDSAVRALANCDRATIRLVLATPSETQGNPMIATLQPTLLDMWRRCFGGRQQRIDHPRRAAALGYMARGPVENGLIEVSKLTLVIMYVCQVRPWQRALRLAGFLGKAVPWGVRWGGPDRCRFVKDLLLQPVPGGPGLRFDAANSELLTLAMQLHGELARAVHYRRLREQVQLPKVWAGFDPATAATITGDGPELAAYSERTGRHPQCLLNRLRLDYSGLALFPLAWTSHVWDKAVTVFADLERFPRRQVFRLEKLPADLTGFHAAAEFDFSHFCSAAHWRSRHRRQSVLVSAV